jgi:hypothetical protein
VNVFLGEFLIILDQMPNDLSVYTVPQLRTAIQKHNKTVRSGQDGTYLPKLHSSKKSVLIFPKAKFQDIRDSEWTQVERQTEPKHGGARLVEAGQSTEGTSAEETGSASGTTCIASEETGSASETTDSEKARQLGDVIIVNLPDSEIYG